MTKTTKRWRERRGEWREQMERRKSAVARSSPGKNGDEGLAVMTVGVLDRYPDSSHSQMLNQGNKAEEVLSVFYGRSKGLCVFVRENRPLR